MPAGQFAKPFDIRKSLSDLRIHIPKILDVVECPTEHKTFDKFATIELLDEEMQGEIDYYCPHCDALILREFCGPSRSHFEIVDHDHKIEKIEAK